MNELQDMSKEQLVAMVERVRLLHRPVRPHGWAQSWRWRDRRDHPDAMVCWSCEGDCHDGEGISCEDPFCSPWPCNTVRVLEGLDPLEMTG